MKKIILSLIIVIAIIVICFIGENPIIKRGYDEIKNLYSYIKVKTSNEYASLDTKTKYYKQDKEIRIPILIYHEIPKKEPTRDQFYMQTTAKKFEEQVKGLIDEGYEFISYDDLIDYSEEKKTITEKSVLIGFDDGWIRKL